MNFMSLLTWHQSVLALVLDSIRQGLLLPILCWVLSVPDPILGYLRDWSGIPPLTMTCGRWFDCCGEIGCLEGSKVASTHQPTPQITFGAVLSSIGFWLRSKMELHGLWA